MTDPDSQLWAKWLAGTKAFDRLYAEGERCPSNPKKGAQCLCTAPTAGVCKIWVRLAELGAELGGGCAAIVKSMD